MEADRHSNIGANVWMPMFEQVIQTLACSNIGILAIQMFEHADVQMGIADEYVWLYAPFLFHS